MVPQEAGDFGHMKDSTVWLTAGIFCLLLSLSPIVVSLPPYPEIYRDGVWSGSYTSNASYPWRRGLIALGLLGAISAAFLASRVIAANRFSPPTIVTLSMAVGCWALGWRSYPYWINGIYHASDHAGGGMFDPKALPPMTWIGELWRFPILILYPVALLGSLGLLFIALLALRKSQLRAVWPWGVIFASAVTLWSLIYSPVYGTWLMD